MGFNLPTKTQTESNVNCSQSGYNDRFQRQVDRNVCSLLQQGCCITTIQFRSDFHAPTCLGKKLMEVCRQFAKALPDVKQDNVSTGLFSDRFSHFVVSTFSCQKWNKSLTHWQDQPGQATFDLRANLQKRDNVRATYNKTMYTRTTTDPQHLKLKKGKISECVIEIIAQ